MANRSTAWVLFPTPPKGWRVAAVSGGGAEVAFRDLDAPATGQAAEAVASFLKAEGYNGQGVLLALPSAWCLCAPVAAADLPPRNRRTALTFRLEEKLPVSAEDVVADFVPGGEPALGVCVETRHAAPLVEALESQGVAVQSIVPASFLALQGWMSTAAQEVPPDFFIWSDKGQLELVAMDQGRPRAWYVLPEDAADAASHAGIEMLNRPVPARLRAAGGVSPAVFAALASLPNLTVEAGGADVPPPETAAARAAAAVLAGKMSPWVELRHGALAPRDPARQIRRPLTAFAAAAILFAAALAAAMFVRAARYDELARRNEQAQREVFRRVFPGRQVPVDVQSRLASEALSLRAMTGDDPNATAAAATAGAGESGPVTLRDLLAALPDDVRFRVLEVRLDEGRLTLEGQALAHGDADAIAAALRRGGRFDVGPPRTEQLAGEGAGISFTIAGSVVAQPPGAALRPREAEYREDDDGGEQTPLARRAVP